MHACRQAGKQAATAATSICEWRIVMKTRKSERAVRAHRSFKPCALARAPHRHTTRARHAYERERGKEKERGIARLPLFVLTKKQFPTKTSSQRPGRRPVLPVLHNPAEGKKGEKGREREREKRRARIDVARRTACDPFPTPDAGARDEGTELPHVLPSGDGRDKKRLSGSL